MKSIAEIAAERDYWREYARQLEKALTPLNELPEDISRSLSLSHQKILATLIALPVASKEAIWLSLYGDRLDTPADDSNVVCVLVHQLRQKLSKIGSGAWIENVWSIGYRLTPEARQTIKDLKKVEADFA